jgi:hypothetical protein
MKPEKNFLIIIITVCMLGLFCGLIFPPVAADEPSPEDYVWRIVIIKYQLGDASEFPTADFAGANDMVRENRRQALLNKLDAVIRSINATAESGEPDYTGTSNQLASIQKLYDGCSVRHAPDTIGSGYTPDWITGCPSQSKIYDLTGNTVKLMRGEQVAPGCRWVCLGLLHCVCV